MRSDFQKTRIEQILIGLECGLPLPQFPPVYLADPVRIEGVGAAEALTADR